MNRCYVKIGWRGGGGKNHVARGFQEAMDIIGALDPELI